MSLIERNDKNTNVLFDFNFEHTTKLIELDNVPKQINATP
jgi:hypothetical protein